MKCKHGSTTGQLDPPALFYLRSRGIGEEAARALLTYAFASDVVQRIGVEALRAGLTEHLQRRLPGPADIEGGSGMSTAAETRRAAGAEPALDVAALRRDFPILARPSTASRSSTSTTRPAPRSRGR